MHISPKEIEAIVKLPPLERYKYFIRKVVDFEELFVLANASGDWATAEVKGRVTILVWPAAAYANLNAVQEWSNFQAQSVELDYFINTYLSIISEKKQLIDVFSIDGKSGFVVSTDEFTRDIEQEGLKY